MLRCRDNLNLTPPPPSLKEKLKVLLYLMDLCSFLSQCLKTCFKNANENNDHALGNQLFMQFSLDQTTQPLCKGSPADQEIAVLKHLRIVYTQDIIDLVLRLKTASIDNETGKIFCS